MLHVVSQRLLESIIAAFVIVIVTCYSAVDLALRIEIEVVQRVT